MARKTPEDFIPDFWKNIHYREEPFKLRAGGESHYFVDAKQFLSDGKILKHMGKFALQAAWKAGMDREATLAANGSGATALQVGMVLAALKEDTNLHFITINTNSQPDRFPPGIGELRLENEKVVLVDDMLSTGSSLIESAAVVQEAGGSIEGAVVLGDRSDGSYYSALHQAGIPKIVSLYQFYEGSPPVLAAS